MNTRERRIKRHKEIMSQLFTDLGYDFVLRDSRYFTFYGKKPSMLEFDSVTYRAYKQLEQEEGTSFKITELLA